MIKEQTSPYKVGDESINNYFKGKVTHAVNVRTHTSLTELPGVGFHYRQTRKNC